MGKLNIKDLSIDGLATALSGLDERRHRRSQVMKWLYQKGAARFSLMTDLPLSLRKELDRMFEITSLRVIDSVSSEEDISQKFLLATDDSMIIEAVLMQARNTFTICVSSQIGCRLGCLFCNTGRDGFRRDLRADEILNQVLYFKVNHIPPRRRFNIVFMGMGEPIMNMQNLEKALVILNHNDGFGLGAKRITVSTIGFPRERMALSATHLKFVLAVSLNATKDETRSMLMPSSGSIEEVLDAAEHFAVVRKSRATIEYVLISGVNDSPEDASRLSAMTAGRPFKINLIPFNEWEGCDFRRPSEDRIEEFIRILLPKAPAVTLRRSQGRDIGAACGQLRSRIISD